MKFIKYIVFTATIVCHNLIAMHPDGTADTGKGLRANKLLKPVGTNAAARLPSFLTSSVKTSDQSAGEAAATAVTSSVESRSTSLPSSPVTAPALPTPPKVSSSRSPVFTSDHDLFSSAGAGAGTKKEDSSTDSGYDSDSNSDYESDSDKSIRYKNPENPPLHDLSGSSYVPSNFSMLTGRSDHYQSVLSSLASSNDYNPRELEKVFTQVGSAGIDALKIAELACAIHECSNQNKATKPTIPTLVDLQRICKQAQEEEARHMMNQIAESARKLQELKKGLHAISLLYSKQAGSVAEERNSKWGIGSRYKKQIDSYVQTIIRANKLLEDLKKTSADASRDDLK
jgi:hypothetical protein